MESKILVIDDEIMICDVLKEYGEEFEGYEVDYALNSMQVVERLSTKEYDIITLDIQLGAENGFDVLKLIKEKTDCPVIFVSAVHEGENVVKSFELGAEDYVKKPFEFNELFIRIKRVIERNRINSHLSSELRIADYVIYESTEDVYRGGKKLDILGMPYKILIYLLKNPNRTISREEFYRELWGADYEFSSRVIDSHIKKVRNSTKDNRIQSIRGMGYEFKLD